MKKTLRIMGLCALVVLAVVSCKKKEESVVTNCCATINPPTYDSKTYLGLDHYLYWTSGDVLKVFAMNDDSITEAADFVTNEDGVKVANFSGSISQAESYYAFYPAANISYIGNNSMTMSIPSSRQFVANGFATNTYIMAAKNDEGSLDFDFQGLFGLLAIPMKGDVTIGSIKLIDSYFNLWGDVSQLLNGFGKGDGDDFMEGMDSRDGKNTITLDCGSQGYTLGEVPDTVYFVLRPLACYHGFTLVVEDLAGDTLLVKSTTANNIIQPEMIRLMPEITVNNPFIDTWHTWCDSEFNNVVGSSISTTPSWAYEYPASFLSANYAGCNITKVSLFSDSEYGAVGGNYTCRIYEGGERPASGTMVSTITVDVPQNQNAWVDWDLTTPVNVTGNDTIWVVWTANTSVSNWPVGCCDGLNDYGTWWDGGEGWEHLSFGTWTMRQWFTNSSGRSFVVSNVVASAVVDDTPVASRVKSNSNTSEVTCAKK